MMFSRAVALAISALPLLAAATPLEARQSCDTAPIQCCASTTTAGSPAASKILGLLGVVVQDLDVLVGLGCSPISVVGVGAGNSCSGETVCCADNSHGLISIGCVPVSA
ncbi:fungal hydrophobin [Trametes cingulata]|nr:fungal hydrophobin [Trametes cingulata]